MTRTWLRFASTSVACSASVLSMGTRHYHRTPMLWQSNLGAMRAAGTVVIRTCSACGLHGDVDVEHMIRLLGGPDMTLWDCRPPCPLCAKPMIHMASPNRGTPMRPLISPSPWGDVERLPLRAWLPGWLGWGGP